MANYASILVGVDFTNCSKVAVKHALRLGAAAGARVQAVHLIDTLAVVELEEMLSSTQRNVRDGLVADAKKAWASFTPGLAGADAVAFDVVINNRVAAIRQKSAEVKADLLVVGAYGDKRPDVGMGTVATACVRHAPTDVLLVRDTHADAFTTIVVGVDFSDTSLRALRSAARVAVLDHARVHAVHVFDAPWHRLRSAEPSPDARTKYVETLRQRLETFVAPVRAEYVGVSLAESLHDAKGHRSGLTEFASSVKADLLVVGTRGKTNLRDVMLGSTAEKALTDSRCSVLAVRAAV